MPPPPPLPDELVEEVLLRFPPENPAGLFRAAFVCRRWRRLVSDPGFRRRFREFHRRPPMLGMLSNAYDYLNNFHFHFARFVPTTGSFSPRTDSFVRLRALDARHGRVLVGGGSVLAVWDPITDEVWELPLPQESDHWTAAVLCSAAADACDHLDCHRGPFLVVFVCSKYGETFVYTYSSDAAAWSEPVCTQQRYGAESWTGSALVGNALYFGNRMRGTALEYKLELHRMSLIRLPSLSPESLLTTTEDGGLGLVTRDVSKFYIWSRKDTHEVDVDAIWERRAIELDTVFPVDVVLKTLYLVGSADGIGIIFMRTGDEVYAIDLKTYKAKKVYEGRTYSVVAYMSFCTPALGGTYTGEGPSASFSSA